MFEGDVFEHIGVGFVLAQFALESDGIVDAHW